MDEKEILLSCFGRNENGEPNVNMSSTLLEFVGDINNKLNFEDPNSYKELSTRYINTGEFKFEMHNGIAQVDISFLSHLSPELRHTWEQLKEYGKKIDEIYFSENPCLDKINFILNISPNLYASQYYICCSNPIMWILQPNSPEEEFNTIIRLFFNSDNIEILEVPEDILSKANEIAAANSRNYDIVYTQKKE